MFKEICILPQVFDSENINNSNWKDVKNLLEAISQSGFILGLNNKEWTRTVHNNISHLPATIRDRISSAILLLKGRDRIVGHPQHEQTSDGNEQQWLQIAMQLDKIRPFYKIIATQSFGNRTLSLEQLEDTNISETFGITGSHHYVKSTDNLRHILLPFLSYAKKVTIIDPYFYLHKKNFQISLGIIAQAFRERRGEREFGKIIIHCRWVDDRTAQTKDYIESWQHFLRKFKNEAAHEIEIYGWEVKENSQKLHDRYIITNQGGLVSAAGTDKDDFQQSEWSMKDFNERDQILTQYKENSSPFRLKCRVTVDHVDTF